MESKTFSVPNISCGHCVMTIERALGEVEGVAGVNGDAGAKSVTVVWDAPATESGIRTVLTDINYPAA